jgi:hypothetical protein
MKILLAYDGFERSQPALEEAARIAADEPGADIKTLSVVPPDARGSKAGGHVGMAPHAHEDVARAHAYLRERGIPSEMKIAHGDPAEEILREAREGGKRQPRAHREGAVHGVNRERGASRPDRASCRRRGPRERVTAGRRYAREVSS